MGTSRLPTTWLPGRSTDDDSTSSGYRTGLEGDESKRNAGREYAVTTRYAEVSNALVETIIGPQALSSSEVAERADVDNEDARQLWRALGFPRVPDDARVFTA